MTRIAILTGNYNQYRFICTELHLNYTEHFCITDGQSLERLTGLDLRRIVFARYGTWDRLSERTIKDFEHAERMSHVNNP